MTVPPGEADYPIIACPNCGMKYKMTELDIIDDDPPKYNCPNCETEVYEPETS